MDLTFWNVKGYDGVQLTKQILDDKKYSFDEIKVNDSNIIEEINENLEKGGVVFCLSKKKIIKAIYFFKLTTKGNDKNLIFDKKIILDEVNKCIKEFEKDINTALNVILFERHDIDKAIWKENEITNKRKFKTAIKTVKIATWIGIIICCILSLTMIICSSFYSLECLSNNSIEDIKNNETIINYIHEINDYGYFETTSAISGYEDNGELLFIEIILPTIIELFGYILLVISLKEILDLIKNVTNNKTLFTNEKNQLLKKILLRIFIALFFIIGNLILWLIISIILEIIQYLFNYCVYFTNKKSLK